MNSTLRLGLAVILCGLAWASVAAAVPAADELDRLEEQALVSGDFDSLLEHVRLVDPQGGADYEVLWRAARAGWAAGDYLYWEAMARNIAEADAENVEDVLEVENELSRAQGEKLIRLGAETRKLAELAVAANPGRVEGHYYQALGISLYALGKSLVAALAEGLRGKFDSAAGRAEELDRRFDQAGPLRLAGRSYFKYPWPLRDYRKSSKHLEQAVAMAPENPMNHLFLGDTYWRRGKEERAAEEWRMALELCDREGGVRSGYIAASARAKLALR